MLGMVGGAILTLAIAISSAQFSSSPQDMASYCCGSTNSLLLILDGIMLQVSQKSAHTNDLFFTPSFLHTTSFTPCFSKCAYSNT
jgi:hypothetical protein